MTAANLTVVILTKDEERNLQRCLDAVPARYPVVVVDSGSVDATLDIARARGCQIFENAWRGFAGQRNYALESCGIKTEWVLFVDADERYPQAFYDWCENEVAGNADFDAAMVPSTLIFKGVPLRYAPGYPLYHPRLARTSKVRFVPNHLGFGESFAAECRVVNVDIPYRNYFFDGDLARWMHKHIDYGMHEIRPVGSRGAVSTRRGRINILLGSSFLRVPLRFLYHYLWRGGFRDGRAGFEYALMYCWHEATKYVLRRTGIDPKEPS